MILYEVFAEDSASPSVTAWLGLSGDFPCLCLPHNRVPFHLSREPALNRVAGVFS